MRENNRQEFGENNWGNGINGIAQPGVHIGLMGQMVPLIQCS